MIRRIPEFLGCIYPISPNSEAAGAEISFVADGAKGESVEAALTRAVKAGAQIAKQPVRMPCGQTVAYVRNLNGFLVEICTPVSA
jgi:lactoylglutathione lyase